MKWLRQLLKWRQRYESEIMADAVKALRLKSGFSYLLVANGNFVSRSVIHGLDLRRLGIENWATIVIYGSVDSIKIYEFQPKQPVVATPLKEQA